MTSATSIVWSAAALAALVLATSFAPAQTAQERSACIGDAFRLGRQGPSYPHIRS
jgi:hypothetical protein